MNSRFWAIIPAAGSGSRLNADKPKQYLNLSLQTVLYHSASIFCRHQRFHAVIVALSPLDEHFSDSDAAELPVQRVEGGATRHQSVLSALRAIGDKADKNDKVFVHDAARPLLTLEDLNRLCDAAEMPEWGGVLAAPVADTLKRVNSDGFVSSTLDRSAIWRALTPQVFPYQSLRDALEKTLREGVTITDEASAMEYCGFPVAVLKGRDDNLKITQGQDLMLAEQIFHWQQANGLRDK